VATAVRFSQTLVDLPARSSACRAAHRAASTWTVVPAALALAASLALAGCTSGGTGEERQPQDRAGSAAPGGLSAAVRDFARTSYRFTMTAAEGDYQGAIDPAADRLTATVSVTSRGATLKIETLGADGEYFVRLAGLPSPLFDPAAWYRIDTARIRSPGALGISANKDPTGVRALAAAVVTVRPDGEHGYQGTVDLTRVTNWGPVNVPQIAALGEAAKATPYRASVDPNGRLTAIAVTVPSAPGAGSAAPNTVAATYRDFGSTVSVVSPVAATALPDFLYTMLGLA
jgi:hypothetical protein